MPFRLVGSCALAWGLTVWAAPASAQSVLTGPAEPHAALKEGKILHARRAATPPEVDGRLTDEAWASTEPASGLIQRDPDNGAAMTQATQVQVVYDSQYLYVGVRALDADPSAIATGLGRRDEMPQTDLLAISFDPRHDHRTGYMFMTNPSAWQSDSFYFDDTNQDRDYNAVWEVRTAITDDGWTAEYRVPFSQMRFTTVPGAQDVWGFSIHRQIRRRGELGAWVARPRGERGEVSFFGHLVFDDPVPSPRRFELTPYLLARTEHRPASPGEAGSAVGADLRVGIGTGATFSATVNPDFGQVEQDPAVLNLSVFETFFPEKRPFFLEDSRTFVPAGGQFQLFHSRRIGRAPGRLPLAPGERLVDRPAETTILGATKLTGKTGGWTYGALTALTAREYATVEATITHADGSTGAVRRERLIEPATSYNVARLQRDLGNGSSVGVIATGVIREQLQDAVTAGADYNLRWDRNRQGFSGHWVVTHAPGPGGMRTSGGGVASYNISRKHVNTGGSYDHFGRDFRVTDIGFFRTRGNRHRGSTFVEVGNPDPWRQLRSVWTFHNFAEERTDEGLLIGRFQESGLNVRFLNFWQVLGGAGREFERFDDLDTRGGPPILRPGSSFVFYRVNSDSRKRWSVNFYGNRWWQDAGGRGGTISPGVSLQPSDRLQASVGVNYNYGVDVAQWIANVDATGDGVVDHVYGTLERDVLDITIRGTYAFSRDLTLQAYLQPFVAAGDYRDIRRLAQPRSYLFEPVTIASNPDFNRKSVRGNVVMRWEYVRGSTLFLVWDLAQSDLSRPGEFSPLRDLGRAFGADATHIFMVKASYWLNR